MFDRIGLMQMAQSMARQAALRQGAIAENIANADTPGYRVRDVASFAETYQEQSDLPMRATRAGHIGADGGYSVTARTVQTGDEISPNGNDVSIEDEMVKAVEVQRQHDLALTIYKSSLDILRSSLGKA